MKESMFNLIMGLLSVGMIVSFLYYAITFDVAGDQPKWTKISVIVCIICVIMLFVVAYGYQATPK